MVAQYFKVDSVGLAVIPKICFVITLMNIQ